MVTAAMLTVALATPPARAQPPAPTAAQWRADLTFLDATIRTVHPNGAFPLGRSRQELFDLLALVETVPASAEAWVARGRVHGFVGDWPAARGAYQRAFALRPNDELIRRLVAVANRR